MLVGVFQGQLGRAAGFALVEQCDQGAGERGVPGARWGERDLVAGGGGHDERPAGVRGDCGDRRVGQRRYRPTGEAAVQHHQPVPRPAFREVPAHLGVRQRCRGQPQGTTVARAGRQVQVTGGAQQAVADVVHQQRGLGVLDRVRQGQPHLGRVRRDRDDGDVLREHAAPVDEHPRQVGDGLGHGRDVREPGPRHVPTGADQHSPGACSVQQGHRSRNPSPRPDQDRYPPTARYRGPERVASTGFVCTPTAILRNEHRKDATP
ncbi:hypothetical protein CLV40_11114 [Actinokineospora auranticolor]|uniref:Uncharacterized protein n=1 Tax=Actinokineospora auranticolor TaxID=155976 RepID=A0A2S6GLJ1_9PSEU|nr:hypothetical protein CLV40_11114 [Actinokineospora auranticolor]